MVSSADRSLVPRAHCLKRRKEKTNKRTVQLSKPVDGLTETGVRALAQTVCVFWNKKEELYRESVL